MFDIRISTISILVVLFCIFCLGNCTYENECTDTGLKYVGTYIGTKKHTGGCYACIPFIDTSYTINVPVSFVRNDSFQIEGIVLSCTEPTHYYPSTWYRVKGTYFFYDNDPHGSHLTIEFKYPDSLKYDLNFDGSAGYSYYSFRGKRQ